MPASTPENLPDLLAACRRLHSAYDRFDHSVATLLGLSRNDLRCLNLLENGPLGVGEIGRQLELSSGALTALVDRLEANGFAKRLADPDDRRAVKVEATPALYRKLATVYKRLAKGVAEKFAEYDDDDFAVAIRSLNDVAEACDAANPEPRQN